MMLENGKSAVPIPSVGADGEQPIPKNSEISIAESDLNSNPLEHDFDEMFTIQFSRASRRSLTACFMQGRICLLEHPRWASHS